MSINWVMLDAESPTSFTPLPSETTLFKSPPRTTLSLQSLSKFPAAQPFHISSSSGVLHLTNRRIVYIPSASTPQLQSFTAPILNLHDSHVTTPWIGPNVWTALVQPVQGGGLPPQQSAIEVKITFKDGGAYDFQTRYERVRERLQQAVEVARASGGVSGDGSESGRGRGGSALDGVNVNNVHLEELPRYEEARTSAPVPAMMASSVQSTAQDRQRSSIPMDRDDDTPVRPRASERETFGPPDEPPPNYEDVQREVIEDEFSRRLDSARLDPEEERR